MVTMIPVVNWALWTVTKNQDLRNWRSNGEWRLSKQQHCEHQQNTQKSHGDLTRLAIIQTSVKNNQLKLLWKTHKEADWNWPSWNGLRHLVVSLQDLPHPYCFYTLTLTPARFFWRSWNIICINPCYLSSLRPTLFFFCPKRLDPSPI